MNKQNKPLIKYSRPSMPISIHNRAFDFADVINKHLGIRLKEETKLLMEISRKAEGQQYIEWFKETEKRNSDLITKEVARLSNSKAPIDFYSDEGKYIIGKSLLDKFIRTKRNEVINLRKAMGLEYVKYSNKNIILTNGIEHSDIFRLFGCPLTLEELKINYKTLAKKCHSDLGGSDNLMSSINAIYKRIVDDWEIINPSNLAISEKELKEVLATKFKNPELINLLDF